MNKEQFITEANAHNLRILGIEICDGWNGDTWTKIIYAIILSSRDISEPCIACIEGKPQDAFEDFLQHYKTAI